MSSATLAVDPASDGAPCGRRLTANFLVLCGGEFLAKGLTFAAFVYLGRILGPERYGGLEFVLAAMVFFTLPVDFGLGTYGTCELARDRGRAARLLREVAAARLSLAIVSFVALLGVVAVLPQAADVKLLLVVYGLTLFAEPALVQWYFQAHDCMHWVAVATLTRKGLFSGLVLLLVRADTPLVVIGACEGVAVLATVAVCLTVLTRRSGRRPPWPWAAPGVLVAHFRKAMPIGLSELAWACQWYSATILLGLLVGGEALGWFGAAHRLVIALHTFVWLYFFNLLPSLSRAAATPAVFRDLIRRSLAVTAWGGFGVALAATLLSDILLPLVFGSRFAAAGRPFAVLVWMIPIAMVSGNYRYALIASGRQTLEFYCTLVAAVVSAALAWLLIPRYGALGAVCALLAANLVNLGCAFVAVYRYVDAIPCHVQLLGPLLALTGAVAVYLTLAPVGPVPAVAAAAVAYGLPLAWWGRRSLGLAQPRAVPEPIPS